MDRLTEYFVRHYTLVIDNDQGSYNAAVDATKEVMRVSDVTPDQYRAMSAQERVDTFAADVGDRILDLIQQWCEGPYERDDIGALIMREILIFSDSDIGFELGAHYLPEDAEADEYLYATEDESDV